MTQKLLGLSPANPTGELIFHFRLVRVLTHKFGKYIRHAKRIVDYARRGGGICWTICYMPVRKLAQLNSAASRLAELDRKFYGKLGFIGARSPDTLDDFLDSFDAAFLIEVVQHLYDNELVRCLSQVRSLLKESGVLIVTTPNEEDRSKQFILSPESGLLFHRFQHVRSWSATSLAATLEAHGFRCIETGSTDFGASVRRAATNQVVTVPVRPIYSQIRTT